MSEQIGIGTELWWRNSRSQRDGWKSYLITGETRQSWLLGKEKWDQRKISKKTLKENNGRWGVEQFLTKEQMENWRWVESHRHKILSCVQFCWDAEKMKQVAKIMELEL